MQMAHIGIPGGRYSTHPPTHTHTHTHNHNQTHSLTQTHIHTKDSPVYIIMIFTVEEWTLFNIFPIWETCNHRLRYFLFTSSWYAITISRTTFPK